MILPRLASAEGVLEVAASYGKLQRSEKSSIMISFFFERLCKRAFTTHDPALDLSPQPRCDGPFDRAPNLDA